MEAMTELGVWSALLAGISLSAAAGLRVFVPVLALGLAAHFGLLELGEGFAWLASEPVLLVVGVAAMLEIGGYFVPLFDNVLDVLTTPAALGGGTVIVASLLPEMNAVAQWGTAALLGGGTAGVVQATTVAARGVSTASTGGLANPVLAASETGGSLIAVLLALIVPLLFGVVVIVLLVWLSIRGITRWRAWRQAADTRASAASPETDARALPGSPPRDSHGSAPRK